MAPGQKLALNESPGARNERNERNEQFPKNAQNGPKPLGIG